jgi:thiamine biosynthesis lipoprotein
MIKKIKNLRLDKIFLCFLILVSAVLAVILIYIGLERNNKSFISCSVLMGSRSRQIIFGDNAEKAAEEVKAKVSELEEIISSHIYASDIERINNAAGNKWVKVNGITVEILNKVLDVSKRSRGVFDPTILRLIQIIETNKNNVQSYNQSEFATALKNVDFRKLKIDYDSERIKLENPKSGITLDMIAEGAVCGEALKVYKSLKVNRAMIAIGDAAGVYESNFENNFWEIPIKDPKNESVAAIRISNGFAASFNAKGGPNKLAKIINAETGETGGQIAYNMIICYDGIMACALSCVCAVLDLNKSLEILKYYGADAVFIKDNIIKITPALVKKIIKPDNKFIIEVMGENEV